MTSLRARLAAQGLYFRNALERPELLSPTIHTSLAAVTSTALVAPIRDEESDTAAFFQRFHLEPNLGANCVIVEGRRGETRQLAACVALGADRMDLNGAVRKALDARRIRIAPADALALLGMEAGGVSPFGLPADWPILVDIAVAGAAELIIGSGIRASKLLVEGAAIAGIPGARILELT
ncbi:TPA: hypothetical protein SMR47_000163 [Pseudomonas putida]|nr:hypothetical protein [Pseudomonas putida]